MVTLSHAIRLCDVSHDDVIYLSTVSNPREHHICSMKQVCEKLDMKSICVHRICPYFSFYGEYKGLRFFVTGISDDELRHIRFA